MINECSTKIETLTGEIAVDGAELRAATEIRAKEQAASLPEELLAVELAVLAREMKKGASHPGTGDEKGCVHAPTVNAGRAAQALQVMVEASTFGPAGASR